MCFPNLFAVLNVLTLFEQSLGIDVINKTSSNDTVDVSDKQMFLLSGCDQHACPDLGKAWDWSLRVRHRTCSVIRVHKCNDCHQHYTGWDEDGCVPFDNCEGDGQTIYTDHKNQRGYWASKSGRKECHRLLQHSYGGCIDRFGYPSNADHSTSIDVECTW